MLEKLREACKQQLGDLRVKDVHHLPIKCANMCKQWAIQPAKILAIEARNQTDFLHCPPDFTQGGTAALFNLMIIKLNKQIISSGTAPFTLN